MDIHVSGFYPVNLPGIQSGPRSKFTHAKISLFAQSGKELPKLAQRFFVPVHEATIILVN